MNLVADSSNMCKENRKIGKQASYLVQNEDGPTFFLISGNMKDVGTRRK